MNNFFYESEARRIAALNEIFGEMELTAARRKAAGTTAPSVGQKSSRQGAKAAFDGRNGCRKCFCVTFGESNKDCAPYPALITARKGERRVIEENDQFYDRERLCQP